MRPNEAFSNLVGEIYDCALDNSRWPEVLGKITDALGGVMADLIISNPLKREQDYAAHYNVPQEIIDLAIANAPINPALPLGLAVPLLKVFCSSRDVDIKALH